MPIITLHRCDHWNPIEQFTGYMTALGKVIFKKEPISPEIYLYAQKEKEFQLRQAQKHQEHMPKMV